MPLTDKRLFAAKFLEQFDPSIHDAIKQAVLRYPDCEAVVCFMNEAMDSSSFGERQALVVGPSNTFKSVADCEGKWLKDLPSQRQYPQNWCPAAELK